MTQQFPEGWIGISAAAEILGMPVHALRSRLYAERIPWGRDTFKQVDNPHGRGKIAQFNEANLANWAKANPDDLAAYRGKRKPGRKKKAASKKKAAKTPGTSVGGMFVTRDDIIAALITTVDMTDEADEGVSTHKLGVLLYDVLTAQVTSCCKEAAKRLVNDTAFKEFYLESRFCPLCGEQLKGRKKR